MRSYITTVILSQSAVEAKGLRLRDPSSSAFRGLLRMTLATAVLFLAAFTSPAQAADKIRIVATTTTLESLAQEVAGETAGYYVVASPRRDLHYETPTPKDVLMVRKADFLIHHGVQAEIWLPPLLHAAGNDRLLSGEAMIDASTGIEILEVPPVVTRLEGDIHPAGNPHYWLDPENASEMVRNIERRLSAHYPESAAVFQERSEDFIARLKPKIREWERRLEPYRGAGIVSYHRSWLYFARRFGLRLLGEMQPQPGIPPTAKHLARLIQEVKAAERPVIFEEPHYESRTPKKVALETGAPLVEMAQFVGGRKEIRDYISLTEFNVSQLEKALGAAGKGEQP